MARKEVAVVGAGVAGLAIAWRLAEAGCRVIVFDAGRPGAATRASAGMLCARLEMTDAPADLARFALAGRAAWPDFATRLKDQSGYDVGLRERGALDVAFDAAVLAPAGPGVQSIDGDVARAIEPALSPSIAAAHWAAGEAHADPRALALALRESSRRHGVEMIDVQVDRVVVESGKARGLDTASGRVAADHVVVAAGAWSSDLLTASGLTASRIRPVKGQMLSLAADRNDMPVSRPVWNGALYIVPHTDGRVIVGATQEDAGFDTTLDKLKLDTLKQAAIRVIPALARLTEIERFAGFRPATDDRRPVIGGFDSASLTIAAGQFRNGILLAPVIAEAAVSHVLTGELPEVARPFAPLRLAEATT